MRSSCCGTAETNPTRNHEVVGSIPGLAQWVTDLNIRSETTKFLEENIISSLPSIIATIFLKSDTKSKCNKSKIKQMGNSYGGSVVNKSD